MKIIALGGIEEHGKNCYIIENKNDIIILDMGSKKYDNSSLGVDTVINSMGYLEKNKNKIKAVLISHSHFENMGGLEYFINHFDVPVYGSEYTVEFLKKNIKSRNFKNFKTNQKLRLGEFVVENFGLSHSVFGHLGFLIAQGKDAVVYATDYNFMQSSKISLRTDIEKIIKLKSKYNIKALMTESKYADHLGVASSDLSFMPTFERLAENVEGKLFISLYSNNISGMINIIKVAQKFSKKIVIIGKELLTYVNVSKKMGYIDHVSDMFIKIKDISRYEDDQIIVVVSGEFLEPFITLKELSATKHSITTIASKDTLMIASEPYDEVEGVVQEIMDKVSRTDCKIVDLKVDVSAHAHEEDIKMMINLFEPQFIIPISGEYRKLKKVQELAVSLGYKEENARIISNGDVVDITDEYLNIIDVVKVDSKLVNGELKETINPMLLYDREVLTEEGYVLITLVVDKRTQELIQPPELLSGGLMNFNDDKPIKDKCTEIACKELEKRITPDGLMKTKNKIKRFLNNKIGKAPAILTVKIEVK